MRRKVWPECGSGTRPTGRVHSKGLHFDHTIPWSTETRPRAPNKCANYRRHVMQTLTFDSLTNQSSRKQEVQKRGSLTWCEQARRADPRISFHRLHAGSACTAEQQPLDGATQKPTASHAAHPQLARHRCGHVQIPSVGACVLFAVPSRACTVLRRHGLMLMLEGQQAQPWAALVVHISATQVAGITVVHASASPSETRSGQRCGSRPPRSPLGRPWHHRSAPWPAPLCRQTGLLLTIKLQRQRQTQRLQRPGQPSRSNALDFRRRGRKHNAMGHCTCHGKRPYRNGMDPALHFTA